MGRKNKIKKYGSIVDIYVLMNYFVPMKNDKNNNRLKIILRADKLTEDNRK